MLSNPLKRVIFRNKALDYFRFAIGPQNIDPPASSGIFPRHESWSVLEHPSNMRPRRPGSSQQSCHNQTSQLTLIAVATRLRASAGSNADRPKAQHSLRPKMPASLPCCRRVHVGFLPRSSHRFGGQRSSRNPRSGERENGHAALRNSHAPAFRGGMRDSASGTQKRWVAGLRP